jgi:hypothetical protein
MRLCLYSCVCVCVCLCVAHTHRQQAHTDKPAAGVTTPRGSSSIIAWYVSVVGLQGLAIRLLGLEFGVCGFQGVWLPPSGGLSLPLSYIIRRDDWTGTQTPPPSPRSSHRCGRRERGEGGHREGDRIRGWVRETSRARLRFSVLDFERALCLHPILLHSLIYPRVRP